MEVAHLVGRKHDGPATRPGFDLDVHPDSVIPLCPACHRQYDSHALNVLPHVTPVELAWCVARIGEGSATRRLMGAEWRHTENALE